MPSLDLKKSAQDKNSLILGDNSKLNIFWIVFIHTQTAM